jgi:hypothetical protein
MPAASKYLYALNLGAPVMGETMRVSVGVDRCAASPIAAFKTRSPRKPTFLAGKLVYGDGPAIPDGAFTLDCAIRDLSEGGAKISLSRQQSLPPELYLIIIKYGIAYRARITWQQYPARGLKFLMPYHLTGTMPADAAFLRTLWLELAARDGGDFLERAQRTRHDTNQVGAAQERWSR